MFISCNKTVSYYTTEFLLCQIGAPEQAKANGTKAAAITFFEGAKNAAPPEEIIFDHPFIFTITDTSNGMPLFIGITADLS